MEEELQMFEYVQLEKPWLIFCNIFEQEICAEGILIVRSSKYGSALSGAVTTVNTAIAAHEWMKSKIIWQQSCIGIIGAKHFSKAERLTVYS